MRLKTAGQVVSGCPRVPLGWRLDLEVFAPRQFAIWPAPILLAVLGFCLICALAWSNVVQALAPAQVAVLVNKRDPNSVRLGEYYLQRRGLAPKQLFAVEFPPGPVLDPAVFARVYRDVTSSLPAQTQALALAWTYPYRVGCMSVTTAFAAGYDPAFCATGCKRTRESPYFDSPTRMPFRDHRWRPAMLLAGSSPANARALIDRGVASDGTVPSGTAYLLRTSDRQRNVRARGYRSVLARLQNRFKATIVRSDSLRGRQDIMFYFTGRKWVTDLSSNGFLPGAVGDHLTSSGGQLDGTKQMSILRWLDAGATGSFGAVVEPCNFLQKFPNPEILMRRYLAGETLIEAYWKSVHWPGQGVFVGEPLARPFAAR